MTSAYWGRTASEIINLSLADGYSPLPFILPTYFSYLYFVTATFEPVNQNFHFLPPKMASNSSSVRVSVILKVLRALRDLRRHRSLPLFIVWWHLIFHDKSENIALYAQLALLAKNAPKNRKFWNRGLGLSSSVKISLDPGKKGWVVELKNGIPTPGGY